MTKQREQPALDDMLETLRQHLPQLREQYGVQRLGVFGSYVHKTQKPGSDLDLLVEFDERPLTLLQFVRLELYLSDLLHLKVDLVDKSSLKPAIGRRILEDVVPV